MGTMSSTSLPVEPADSSGMIAAGSFVRRLSRWMRRLGFRDEHLLTLVAIAVGAATGAGACGFYWLIEQSIELAYGHGREGGMFQGRLWLLVAIPAGGGLLVGLISYYFAREVKGHGVPEVISAIAVKDGRIRPRVAVAQSVASALTIGSGGSAGAEGPIIQIGAAIGSGAGQLLRMQRHQMPVLVACGAAAGISSIFNAPIAGVLFALEIFLRELSLKAFAPVVLASVLSSSVSHWIRGSDHPIFWVGPRGDYLFTGYELPFYLILGLLCAFSGIAFVRLLYATEDVFDRLRIHDVLKPVIGAIGLGLVGVLYCTASSRVELPAFFGNGYPFLEQTITLRGLRELAIPSLLVLWVMKWIATSLTLGSGGSGGVFAPSLFLGAAVGGALGMILLQLGWITEKSVTAYALVGMAATVAATTHAPLTAIVILIEMTRDYKVILPVMFAAIVATNVARLMLRDSIFTLKLRRRGVRIGSLADRTILRRIAVWQIPRVPATRVRPDDPMQIMLDLAGESQVPDFVVVDADDRYLGMVFGDDITTALLQPEAVPLLVVGELLREDVPTVRSNETLDTVLNKFAQTHSTCLPVVSGEDGTRVEFLITRHAVMQRYHAELERIQEEE